MIIRRGLHVLQSPTTSIPTSLNVSHLVKNVPDLVAENDGSETTFQALGDSASLLRVAMAPSTPVYTKRKSLVATFAKDHAPVVSTWFLGKFVSRLLALQRPFGFQKIVSTSPVTALIGSDSSRLAVVSLDGTIDWIVAHPAALHTFTGEQLILHARRGSWLRKGPPFSYTFLSGRGTVALSGFGQLFKISLEQGESYMALKESVIAYSVDANRRLQTPEFEKLPYSVHQTTTLASPSIAESLKSVSAAWAYVKSLVSRTNTALYRLVNADSGKYMTLHGPTTILVQSAVHHLAAPALATSSPAVLESAVQAAAREIIDDVQSQKAQIAAAGMAGRPEDHLKVATVTNGKVVFESTKNFDGF
ncbi:hypothetical protein TRVA0_005S01288 [Trichomonascus vanleenenianus]|uniref:Aim24p n=1 Tax=Trichomonascus vanleenenianus TaxID=2268995 RepID=UPI003ECA1CB7